MVLNRAASASLANATQSSWSEEQILSACKRLADGKTKPADISAAMQGLNSARPETAEACKKALMRVDPASFNTEHISTIISQISGKGGAIDDFCSALTLSAAIQKDFAFSSNANDEAFRGKLHKLDLLSYSSESSLKAVEAIPDGGTAEVNLGFKAVTYLVERDGGKLRAHKKYGHLSEQFTPACLDALIGKISEVNSLQGGNGFIANEKKENPVIIALSGIVFKILNLDRTEPIMLASRQISSLLNVLEGNPPMDGASELFYYMSGQKSNTDPKYAITQEHYGSMIKLIGNGYAQAVDAPCMAIAEEWSKTGRLSHDGIELFKEGLRNRDVADEYAANYRHVGRYYAKIFTKDDLQIFIDNIDHDKPEYCSGQLCGCKARAIADLANLMPGLFNEKQVDTVINTFKSSLTYMDGAAMTLGYLAVNEPKRLGEKCVNGLREGLGDTAFYDAAIVLLFVARKMPGVYGEKIRGIFLDGLKTRNSEPACLWALQDLKKHEPGLFENASGAEKEKIDQMGAYTMPANKRVDAYNQYEAFNGHFSLNYELTKRAAAEPEKSGKK